MEFIKIEDLIREDGTLQTWTGVGGYRLTFIDEFENVVCGDCSDGSELISPNELKGAFIHWEGPALSCDECGADIPSEYGEADEEDEEDNPEDISKIQSNMARHAQENIRKEAPWILG